MGLEKNIINQIKLLFNSYHMALDGEKIIPLNIGTPLGSKLSPGLFIIVFNQISTYIL